MASKHSRRFLSKVRTPITSGTELYVDLDTFDLYLGEVKIGTCSDEYAIKIGDALSQYMRNWAARQADQERYAKRQ
jgi:hypothetical protein